MRQVTYQAEVHIRQNQACANQASKDQCDLDDSVLCIYDSMDQFEAGGQALDDGSNGNCNDDAQLQLGSRMVWTQGVPGTHTVSPLSTPATKHSHWHLLNGLSTWRAQWLETCREHRCDTWLCMGDVATQWANSI